MKLSDRFRARIGVSLFGLALGLVFGGYMLFGHDTPEHTVEHDPVAHKLLTADNFHPTKALAALRAEVTMRPEEMLNCHMSTHMIGHTAYDMFGDEAYNFVDPMCGGGYLHGVLEQAFKVNGVGYLDSIVHRVCNGEIAESCLHGVGHGLHEVLGDVSKALKMCDLIVSSHSDCYDGVFMDAFDSEGMVGSKSYDLEIALSLCESVHQNAQASCYFYLPRVLAAASYSDIVELCASARVKNGWAACAQGSGVYFMKTVSGFSSERARQSCNAYTDKNQRELCLTGVSAYEQYGAAGNNRWH